jgi:hypothetical protein
VVNSPNLNDSNNLNNSNLNHLNNAFSPIYNGLISKESNNKSNMNSKYLVIIEVDKNNQNIIKKVEVVTGNWMERAFKRIATKWSELTEGRSFHVGSMYRNLSVVTDSLSENYSAIASQDSDDPAIATGPEKEEFNNLVRKMREITFSTLIKSTKKKEDLRHKIGSMEEHHDIAVYHVELRQDCASLEKLIQNGNVVAGKEKEYTELATKILRTRKNIASKYEGMKSKAENQRNISKREPEKYSMYQKRLQALDKIMGQVNKEISDTDMEKHLLAIGLNTNLDLNTLTKYLTNLKYYMTTDSPLKSQIEHLSTLRSLQSDLAILENKHSSGEEFLRAGIQFVEDYYSLDSSITENLGFKERFDALQFHDRSMEIIDKFKRQIGPDLDKSTALGTTFTEYQQLALALKEIQGKITNNDLKGIRAELLELAKGIEEKLGLIRSERLTELHTQYQVESRTNEEQLQGLQESSDRLQQAMASAKTAEAMYSAGIDQIRSGEPKDIARLVSVPDKAMSIEDKKLITALQALVQFMRTAGSTSSEQLEQSQARLVLNLREAGLDKPVGMSLTDFLFQPEVTKKITSLLQRAQVSATNAETAFAKAKAASETATRKAETTRSQLIEDKRSELQQISEVEITSLRHVLGMAQEPNGPDNLSIPLDKLRREVFKTEPMDSAQEETLSLEEKSMKILENLFADLKDKPHILERYQNIYEKEMQHEQSEKTSKLFKGTPYTSILAAITEDACGRRDAIKNEIKTFEQLQHSEFYEMSTSDLSLMLNGYVKKYGLKHSFPNLEDIVKKSQELPQEQAQLLSSESQIISELSEALRYKQGLEDIATRAMRNADEQQVQQSGWQSLMEGLQFLLDTTASYHKSNELTEKIGVQKEQIQQEQAVKESLETRQGLIAKRMKSLKEQLQAQADILSAETTKLMLGHISAFHEKLTQRT